MYQRDILERSLFPLPPLDRPIAMQAAHKSMHLHDSLKGPIFSDFNSALYMSLLLFADYFTIASSGPSNFLKDSALD
jgi:hypothetical protein